MQKLFRYVLYGLLLSVANKNVKNDQNVNRFGLQKTYM